MGNWDTPEEMSPNSEGTVEALAKISDFVAGLMPRIPKRPTKGKVDWIEFDGLFAACPRWEKIENCKEKMCIY